MRLWKKNKFTFLEKFSNSTLLGEFYFVQGIVIVNRDLYCILSKVMLHCKGFICAVLCARYCYHARDLFFVQGIVPSQAIFLCARICTLCQAFIFCARHSSLVRNFYFFQRFAKICALCKVPCQGLCEQPGSYQQRICLQTTCKLFIRKLFNRKLFIRKLFTKKLFIRKLFTKKLFIIKLFIKK